MSKSTKNTQKNQKSGKRANKKVKTTDGKRYS